MLNRRRAAFWLVCLASLMTLGHLLNPHSGTHGFEDAVHAHGEHGEPPHSPSEGEPGHDGGDESCGQAVLPDSCDPAPAAPMTSEPLHDPAVPVAEAACARECSGRSPPDLVAVLQVNRV